MTPHPGDHESRLAAEPLDTADSAALNAVRAYFDEIDPVPDGLVERIQFEITLDALTAEVATLTRIDLADAGVRSTTTEAVRTITFTSETLTTMVTITQHADASVRIDGWAAPGGKIQVEVQLSGGSEQTVADEDGRFAFSCLPSGLARFVLHRGDAGSTVISPTIEL